MSEDVSATMRVGITVILVAALVATVLNLMVMSNSLLSGGQTTLQSGIDSVSTQEFASYDNTKVSGTQVSTALSLFQGRDVAILIQTKSLASSMNSKTVAFNYGALLTTNHLASSAQNAPTLIDYTLYRDDTGVIGDGQTMAVANSTKYKYTNGAVSGTLEIPVGTFLTPNAKAVYLTDFIDEPIPASVTPSNYVTGNFSVWRNTGSPNYSGYLHNTNGLVDANYDIIGTTELGNDAFLLGSARFSSILIKDPTGSIIGIVFKQIQ